MSAGRPLGSALDRWLAQALASARLFGRSQAPVRLGKFQVVGALGRGSSGSVYEALDVECRVPVALKCLAAADPEQRASLKREFRALHDISHENLVQLYELFSHADDLYFTMELVSGPSFLDYVRPVTAGRARLDPSRLRAALRQLVTGVSYLHDAGTIHRDLKPANVVVTGTGRVVILDFGLAAKPFGPAGSDSGYARHVGTPAYTPPEGTPQDRAAPAEDWYAVGVMLFEALTGRRPFDGGAQHVLRAKRAHDAPHPSEFAQDLPPDLTALCVGLLRRNPAERYGRSRVASELGTDPHAPTMVAQGVARGDRFVGRERELAVLMRAYHASAQCEAHGVLIHGDSGVGKSALLDHFVQALPRSALVLHSRCHERELIPYKAFDGAIEHLRRELAEQDEAVRGRLLPRDMAALTTAFPVLRGLADDRDVPHEAKPDAQTLRARAREALKELLRRLARERPIVMVVDDAHWSDADSVRLQAHLTGPPDPPGLLFIAAYRDGLSSRIESDDHSTDAPRTPPGTTVLRLQPLIEDDASKLARHLLQSEFGDDELARRIATESGGSPLLVEELVECVKSTPSVACLDAPGKRLEAAILARVGRLSQRGRRLLETLCVASAPLERAVALSAAQDPGGYGELTRLSHLRLIRSRNDALERVEPYHDSIRQAVLRVLGQDGPKAVHASLVSGFHAHGINDAERLVHHALGAGDLPLTRSLAARAGKAAMDKMAFDRAVRFFDLALSGAERQKDVSLVDLLEHRGRALGYAGRSEAAARSYLRAWAIMRPGRRNLRQQGATHLIRAGHLREGLALASEVLRAEGLPFPATHCGTVLRITWHRALAQLERVWAPPGRTSVTLENRRRIETCASLAQELMYSAPAKSALLQTIFYRLAARSGDLHFRLEAAASRARGRAIAGGANDEQRVLRMLSEVGRLARQIRTPRAKAVAQFSAASGALYMERFADAARIAENLEQRCREQSVPRTFWEQSQTAAIHWVGLQFMGRRGAAATDACTLMREAHERNDHLAASVLLFAACWQLLANDAPGDALDAIERTERKLSGELPAINDTGIFLRTMDTLLYMDDGKAALHLVNARGREVERTAAGSTLMRIASRFAAARGLITAASGTSDALARARAIARRLSRDRTRLAVGWSLIVEAGIRAKLGEVEGCMAMLASAEEVLLQHGVAVHAACARYQRGTLVGGAEGERLILSAHEQMTACGIKRPGRWAAMYAPT